MNFLIVVIAIIAAFVISFVAVFISIVIVGIFEELYFKLKYHGNKGFISRTHNRNIN